MPEEQDDQFDEDSIGREEEAIAGSNLGGANLGGANLGGANVGGTNLGGANLGGANLGGANLGGANLGGANLAGNNLGGANMSATNLGGANLGGANLGGANLGGANLAGSSLGGSTVTGTYAGLGCPKTGTYNLGTDLTVATVATDIHGAVTNNLLRSAEDSFTRTQACVLMGIGSTAFPKLISQNSSDTTMYAAVKELPWGFAASSGGAVVLKAWEVVVWGSSRYAVFVVVAPPGTTYPAVAGYVKAVWRWAAPTTKTLKIGQIGGGQPVASYAGMMNAGSQVLSGVITPKVYIAGQVGFTSATVNDTAVNVDFASWVAKESQGNNPLVLGNVTGSPMRTDAVYESLDLPDGRIGSFVSSFTTIAQSSVLNDLKLLFDAWKAGVGGKPQAKRCVGATYLNFRDPVAYPTPTTKCDTYALSNTFTLQGVTPEVIGNPEGWSPDAASYGWGMHRESSDGIRSFLRRIPAGQVGCSSSTPAYPDNPTGSVYYCSPGYPGVPSGCYCNFRIIAQTYVHLNELPATVTGEGGMVAVSGPNRFVGPVGTSISLTATVTNIGTVSSGAWTLGLGHGAWGVNNLSPAAPISVASLAPGARRAYTFTATIGETGVFKIALTKGTTVLSQDERWITKTP